MATEMQPSTIDTYSAVIRNFTPAATPTDILSIVGNANKQVKILRIEIQTVQTTAGVNEFLLIKRSTLNTGGTRAAMTAVPLDSRSPAATADVGNYSANPAGLGTAIGTIDTAKPSAGAATNSTNPDFVWDYNDSNGSPIVLRTALETLAVNFNGAAVPAGFVANITVRWVEQ